MDFIPLFDRLLATPVNADQVISGMIIPDSSSNFKKAVVVSCGELVVPSVKPGDTVLYEKENGVSITLEGKSFIVLRDKDLWLINSGVEQR